MKLINPSKIDQGVNLNTLIVLIIRCVICIFILAVVSCILGRLMVYFKTNVLFFNWEKDLFYSLKVGISAGALTGIGIWIKAKIQERKENVK
ncbi:hypothetical protein [Tatumella citrea]|uniref:Immunity protein n=1 Tax=Tatumella citrea TaxID=53336 RepID=A0A1Y0L4S9_TATCI|nr:hypothetical protein [Tatumella citrea]ARU92688.1 hypothetical protein A7K98_02090 [Tatumella citrea]ARU96725.1 hypothetical protein A7K99_02090 [Tatumella citrea]